ncbi:MAG: nuclear transport factor 2 family protein [Cellvibrionales bacterium]|jgi:hypothetical protein
MKTTTVGDRRLTLAPQALVEAFYAAALPGDWDAVVPLLHPDFAVTESAALPFAGTYHGLDGLRQLGGAIYAHCSRFEVTPMAYTTGPDRVVVQLHVAGETRVSQRPFTSEILELFLLESGQIREIRPFYWDPSALA